MHQDNVLGYVCMWVCSFFSIACAIYLSHFEEKVSFQVQITLKTGGRVIFTSALDTTFREYFYDCDRSC